MRATIFLCALIVSSVVTGEPFLSIGTITLAAFLMLLDLTDIVSRIDIEKAKHARQANTE